MVLLVKVPLVIFLLDMFALAKVLLAMFLLAMVLLAMVLLAMVLLFMFIFVEVRVGVVMFTAQLEQMISCCQSRLF